MPRKNKTPPVIVAPKPGPTFALVEKPEVRARILESLQAGGTRQASAGAAGIDVRTLRNWVERGNAGEEPYQSFVAEMAVAEADGEDRHVRNIANAVEMGDWHASAWWLSHARRDSWGDQSKVEVDAKVSQMGRIVYLPPKDDSTE